MSDLITFVRLKTEERTLKYKQLTLVKRYYISTLLNRGYKQKEITKEVGVYLSTISRKLRLNYLNFSKMYKADTAQAQTALRHKKKAKNSVLTKLIEKYIRTKLKDDWLPVQILGRMKLDIGLSVAH